MELPVRTRLVRIYAAPEMYYTVPGENRVEIDTKSDFYSLGMVLLCLWMGEKEFKEREFELMKRKRTGICLFLRIYRAERCN